MGYCVEISESTVKFKEDKIKDLMDKVKKDFIEGKIEGRWIYSYEVEEAEFVEEFFDALRLSVYFEDGFYKIDYMSGEKLDGCELELYNSMAEFVDDGYIEYLGEDGERWRYVFKNGKCKEVYPRVIWE